MILVTLTSRNGVDLVTHQQIAIDPEKIVTTRDRELYCEITYGETYDRRRQPIDYVLTTDRASILALILGSYATKEFLSVTVIGSNKEEFKPVNWVPYALDLQEKYIVDIRESYFAVNNVKTPCRRIEYVPGSFVPVVIYVSEKLLDLVTDNPAAVTTTTTTTGTP
jgi:hypothetical protein